MRKITLRYCGALGSLLGPLFLQACQDSTQICEPVTGPDGTVGTTCFEFGNFGKSTLAQSSPEPAGDNCPDGGKRIDTGFDDNDNGTLDPSEVDASTYICDGGDGADGAPGKSALTAVTPVDAGEDCVNGGLRINYGIDADEDGTLSEEESAGTHFVCNGPAGADGDDGSNGSDGIDGEDGAQGAQGAVGADGAQGPQGADGTNGIDGTNGSDGINGATGPQGPQGADGDDGSDGINGATGPQGPQGADGDDGSDGINGATGPQGPQGVQGADGDDGSDGATGPQGPQGADGAGSGSIATFASGAPAVMTTGAGGLQGNVVIVGFGETATTNAVGGVIDGTTLDSLAFSVPRNGTLTSIAGFFNLRTAMALVGSSVTVTGQVYISSTPDNTFTPVPGAIVTLTPMTGVLSVGTVLDGTTTGLAIPVTQGSRVMVVFGSTAAGIGLINSINGTFSAGLTIN